jgi:hypothetical protein
MALIGACYPRETVLLVTFELFWRPLRLLRAHPWSWSLTRMSISWTQPVA